MSQLKILLGLCILFLFGCSQSLFTKTADKDTKEAKEVDRKIDMGNKEYKKVIAENEAVVDAIKSESEDDDNDGLNNQKERSFGTDPKNPDTDGDGISDGDEIKQGTNPLVSDLDTDKDGLSDEIETGIKTNVNINDTDGDCFDDFTEYKNYYHKGFKEKGIFDPVVFDDFSDCDEDGISYVNENKNKTNPDKKDSDDDGIFDTFESNTGKFINEKDTGSDPNKVDSDGDGINDGEELINHTSPVDEDNDGLDDLKETEYLTDPKNPDTDGDGTTDGLEVKLGLNPLVDESTTDKDRDGLPDIVETSTGTYKNNTDTGTNPDLADTDGDGINDGREIPLGLNPNKDERTMDSDGDGLNNLEEVTVYKTNHFKADTEDDGLTDFEEVKGIYKKTSASFSPTNPLLKDTDGDGFLDGDEIGKGTDPHDPKSVLKATIKESKEVDTGFGKAVVQVNLVKDQLKANEVVTLDLSQTLNSIKSYANDVANETSNKALTQENKTAEEAQAIKQTTKKEVEKKMIQAVKEVAEQNGQTLIKDDQDNLVLVNLGYIKKEATAGTLTEGQKDTLGETAVAHMGEGNVDMLKVLDVATTAKKGVKADEILADALPSKSKDNSGSIAEAINTITVIPEEERTKDQKETLGIAAATHMANELYTGAKDEELTGQTEKNVTIYDPNLVSLDLTAKVQQDYDLSIKAFDGINDKWSTEIGKSKTKVEEFKKMDSEGEKNDPDGIITQAETKTFLQHSNEDALKGDKLSEEEKKNIEEKDATLKENGQMGLLSSDWQYKYVNPTEIPQLP